MRKKWNKNWNLMISSLMMTVTWSHPLNSYFFFQLFIFVVLHPVEVERWWESFYKFISLAPEFPVSIEEISRLSRFTSSCIHKMFSRSFFMDFSPIAKETEMKLDTHSWWWWGLMKWFHSTFFYFHSLNLFSLMPCLSLIYIINELLIDLPVCICH